MADPTQVDAVGADSPDAALLLDAQGLITAVNQLARCLLGRWFPGWRGAADPPEPLQQWLGEPDEAAHAPALVLHDADVLLQIRRIELDGMALLLLREIDSGGTERRLRALGLTAREAQIVLIAAEGHTVGHVARRLGISGRTVEKHLQLAYDKLGVHNRVSAANLVADLDRAGPRLPSGDG